MKQKPTSLQQEMRTLAKAPNLAASHKLCGELCINKNQVALTI